MLTLKSYTLTLQAPGEVKPARGIGYRLSLIVCLCPLFEKLVLVDCFIGALLGLRSGLFLSGHKAQDQEAGDEEQGVHGDQVTRGAQPLMTGAARFRRFIQK